MVLWTALCVVTAGQCITSYAGHTGHVKSVDALGDGHLVTASHDKTLKVWDAHTGHRVPDVLWLLSCEGRAGVGVGGPCQRAGDEGLALEVL